MVYLHMCKGVESRSVEVQLLLQSLRWEKLPSRQCSGETNVEHLSCICIRLYVEHKHIIRRDWKHGWHPFQEVSEQRGQEVLLGHVLESHSDATAEHLLRNDENPQHTLSTDAVNAIWETDRDKGRWSELESNNKLENYKPCPVSQYVKKQYVKSQVKWQEHVWQLSQNITQSVFYSIEIWNTLML